MSDLLVRNCHVLETEDTGTNILHNQDILVHGSNIEAVQATGRADASHFKLVIEARGMLAMPGDRKSTRLNSSH